MMLCGWGRFPYVESEFREPSDESEIRKLVLRDSSLIARGNGRAYGDAALNPTLTLSCRRMDRMLAFDLETGVLTCQAGVLLSDIVDVFLPRGWFPLVTPGTKFVTVGGMIAADVHGKNHHGAGSFGRHVQRLRLLQADGSVEECSPTKNRELFSATVGGMGLTGIILDASFRLIPVETAWVRQKTIRAPGIEAAMDAFEANQDATYSVAWIDCLAHGTALGRSLVYLGEHAPLDHLPPALRRSPLGRKVRKNRRIPFDLPSWALNTWSMRVFNELYYRRSKDVEMIDIETFFYPLDAILEWNRIYGRAGFLQYQCVLPLQTAREGMKRLLTVIARSGQASFLAVLKLFGRQEGMLSFPMEGYTLALDFPLRSGVLSLLTELDTIVGDYGGRIYLAKDARMEAGLMRRGYPNLPSFLALRRDTGAKDKFASLQSERLNL